VKNRRHFRVGEFVMTQFSRKWSERLIYEVVNFGTRYWIDGGSGLAGKTGFGGSVIRHDLYWQDSNHGRHDTVGLRTVKGTTKALSRDNAAITHYLAPLSKNTISAVEVQR
jgi:hypothetical protein